MINGISHRAVDSAADTGVRNSQPEGIGRVVALGDLVCWNNLGRNVVFADTSLRPVAVFGTTLFPGDDEPSQYDFDVHAILDLPEFGLLVVLNHLGTVRAFRRADLLGYTGGGLVVPSATWSFAADVERVVAVSGRLVGSAPRSDGAIGVLVTEPLDTFAEGAEIPAKAGAKAFGEVTALGVVRSGGDPLVAIGGDGHVALAPLARGRVGRPRWEAEVEFRVATISWHGGALWAVGPSRGGAADDYDWEQLTGGGFAALDPADGRTVVRGPMPDDVAWGTGGVAATPMGPRLAAAGRTGSLHLVDPRSGVSQCSSAPLASESLGIAHVAEVGGRVCCGFNRGGYRLHSFSEAGAANEAP